MIESRIDYQAESHGQRVSHGKVTDTVVVYFAGIRGTDIELAATQSGRLRQGPKHAPLYITGAVRGPIYSLE